MTIPPLFCANSSARAGLPPAVGPAISTALLKSSEFAGLKAHVAGITERAMRGEIEFEPALRERVALLKDLPVSVVDEVLAKHITPTPGGRELVMTMRASGAYTCLISGGFTLFTHAVAAKIGFQENRANELRVRDGKFTGEVRSEE